MKVPYFVVSMFYCLFFVANCCHFRCIRDNLMILLPLCFTLKLHVYTTIKNLFYAQYCSHLFVFIVLLERWTVFLPWWKVFAYKIMYVTHFSVQSRFDTFFTQYRQSRNIDIGINFHTFLLIRIVINSK